MRVAFLFNVRHTYPDPNDPASQRETDFDDPKTIEYITSHLRRCDYDVLPIEANEEAYLTLYKERDSIDIVFNYAEGIYGRDREAQIPAMLEMLRIPYTGSGPLTQSLGLHKVKAKEVALAHHIPTLPYQLFKSASDEILQELRFPLIVKPVAQGSSAGITNKSVVRSKEELILQIDWVISSFHQPALVEPFLSGREFSVPMIGNPPVLLPIIEADHSSLPKGYLPLDSLEVKWFLEEESPENHLRCPALIEDSLYKRIEEICLHTWEALEVRDWCRIDIRCDEYTNPYFLEINSPPGMIPPEISTTSYFPLAARVAGMEYDELLKKVLEIAIDRSHKNHSYSF
ncbi:MAG TPA: D-alanine--D-alanine ligase [Patescibacteria group bacterium]|nr:D-alanine--D-alanine ligase [Patescibacteria group bacterium]